MSRYIDADKAPSIMKEMPMGKMVIDTVMKLVIDRIPTAADVVEVVRCKNCKHRYSPSCALWYGSLGGIEYFIDRGGDFYCSFGEREDE